MGFFDRFKCFNRRIASPEINKSQDLAENASRLLEESVAQEATGNMQSAIDSLRTAIHLQPNLAQAHFNLGNILLEQGSAREALGAFTCALRCKPDSATCHYNMGNAYLQLGQYQDSIAFYKQALALKPDLVNAEVAMGVALQETGTVDEAITCFQRALSIQPDYAEVHYNLGGAQLEARQLDAAVTSFRRAIEIFPDYAEAHTALANTFSELGEHGKAIECYRQALYLSPNLAEVHHALAQALRSIGQLDQAITNYRRALTIKPDFSEAYGNLGMAQHQLGLATEALGSYRKAVELNPQNIAAANNLGILWHQAGELEMAAKAFRKLLADTPDDLDALNNLGQVLTVIGNLDEAAALYRRVLAIQPDHTLSYSNLLLIHNYLASDTAPQLLAEAQEYGKQVSGRNTGSPRVTSPDPDRSLRIGIVSADLRQHPVGYFVENVLKSLHTGAQDRIELFAYSNHWQVDAISERIKACCRGWEMVRSMNDDRLAQHIRNDKIDILIDLSGHTSDNRLPVFARKPAPIQVTWLGYFATTGVKEIDYLIADPWTLLETEEKNFTETIWRLPETRLCFTPPSEVTEVSTLPALSTGKITFGCFNNLTKMNDEVVLLWARILTTLPNSRLFLKSRQLSESSVKERVVESFVRHAIDPERLLFDAYTPRANYLASYHQIDIALDPFPYTGGTTTVEALWMGVPVLTLAGKNFLSRQGVGLLMNAGLPDWVACDPEDYVARAVFHATNLHRLALLRAALREQVLASPIFDAPRFADHFETALRSMWKKWCDEHPAATDTNLHNVSCNASYAETSQEST